MNSVLQFHFIILSWMMMVITDIPSMNVVQMVIKMQRAWQMDVILNMETHFTKMNIQGILHAKLILFHKLGMTLEEAAMAYFMLLSSICLTKLKNTTNKLNQLKLNINPYHISCLVQCIKQRKITTQYLTFRLKCVSTTIVYCIQLDFKNQFLSPVSTINLPCMQVQNIHLESAFPTLGTF